MEWSIFSHHHAVLHDQNTGKTYTPLSNISESYQCLAKELALHVFLEVAGDSMHAHEGRNVTHLGEVPEDNNDVTFGPATGTETAAKLDRRPESGDGSPEVEAELMRTVMELLQAQTKAMAAQA